MLAAEFGLTVQVSISDVITLPMTLSTFTYGQDDGTADVNCSVTVTEVREVATPNEAKQTAKRPTKKVVSHMYKWKKGDTWKKVAKKETGDSKNYSKLKKANKSRINKAIKAYKKKHNVKTVKETTALIGVKVLIK
jgi:Ni/Co efflux regulator RcnB